MNTMYFVSVMDVRNFLNLSVILKDEIGLFILGGANMTSLIV